MKKRTLRKSNLDELAKVKPVLNEKVQRKFVGGGDGSENCPYTQYEYSCMLDSGSWHGGYVENMGYVLAEVVCTTSRPNHNPTGDERYDNMYSGGYRNGFNDGYYPKEGNNGSIQGVISGFFSEVVHSIGNTSAVEDGDYTLMYYDLGYQKGLEDGMKAREEFDATHPD